nr:MAG TPA: hypothetical protein [Caudoviricetes sp.]
MDTRQYIAAFCALGIELCLLSETSRCIYAHCSRRVGGHAHADACTITLLFIEKCICT